jgi:hypothetical protein
VLVELGKAPNKSVEVRFKFGERALECVEAAGYHVLIQLRHVQVEERHAVAAAEPGHAAVWLVAEFPTVHVAEIVRRIVEGEFLARESVVAAPLERGQRPVELGLERVESAGNEDVGQTVHMCNKARSANLVEGQNQLRPVE